MQLMGKRKQQGQHRDSRVVAWSCLLSVSPSGKAGLSSRSSDAVTVMLRAMCSAKDQQVPLVWELSLTREDTKMIALKLQDGFPDTLSIS